MPRRPTVIPMEAASPYSIYLQPPSSAHSLQAAIRTCWRFQTTASSSTPESMARVQSNVSRWLLLALRTSGIPFRQLLSAGLQQPSISRWLRERRTQLPLYRDLQTAAPLGSHLASLMMRRHGPQPGPLSPLWHG